MPFWEVGGIIFQILHSLLQNFRCDFLESYPLLGILFYAQGPAGHVGVCFVGGSLKIFYFSHQKEVCVLVHLKGSFIFRHFSFPP